MEHGQRRCQPDRHHQRQHQQQGRARYLLGIGGALLIGGSLLLESRFHNLGVCGIVTAALFWLAGWRAMATQRH
jgi:hypothetical protein